MSNYEQIKGAIWYLSYYEKIDVPDNLSQDFINRQTRENLYAFSPPSNLSADEYGALFSSEFLKSRKETKEKVSNTTVRVEEILLFGVQESLDFIIKLQSSSKFVSWENTVLVDMFTYLSQRCIEIENEKEINNNRI